ncbi:MAG: glycoside hydrolase family 3 C-terminal domain-containing protein [Clostridia bacterium]|nr:glycoside hydrolase family 3 C-terminal domain-containing protein [Clostridia bacterium]MBR6027938.1 glycoside hydrolase family 3 C-terminal domain-containing protein [Clostridia bacterium]
MKSQKFASLFRGLAALMACLFVVSSLGAGITENYRSQLDGMLGTSSYVTINDERAARFQKDYATIEDMMAAAKAIAIREGEEGTVVMKNDNDVLPLSKDNEVVLFGLAAYAPYPYANGDLKAGNADAVDLVAALENAGVTINETVKNFYVNGILNKHVEMVPNRWTGELQESVGYDNIYVAAPGDMAEYQIVEVPPELFEEKGAPADWKDSIKAGSVAIVVFARGAGEGNTYAPGSALNYAGEATGKDPLALSDDELAVIDVAKETCGKVLVLINSGNTMVLRDIAKGGAHEVDGIAYIGVINDYQLTGVARVLLGEVNATGALPDTYVADNASNPAVVNFGGSYYADYEIVGVEGTDPRYPGETIGNTKASSFGGTTTYNGGHYIVEAEGIYVGYKYFETRYYDSIMNPAYNAASAAGATQGASWDYSAEVLYAFGHGLSYLDYTQTLKSVNVDLTENGDITAVVEIRNNSDKDGQFLAQLYVQQPYTDYDRENLVEKSSVMFLNSGKAQVKAGGTADVTITVPAKYLASYDYKQAKTWILDDGDYLFTAAAGSHAAVNNFLAQQGKTAADGMDAEVAGAVVVWNLAAMDNKTFATANGHAVTNLADDADLNYWTGTDTVTYLSRQDWEGTYPVNYNDVEVKLADSPRKDEWIAELRGQTYTVQNNSPAAEGVDKGLRFNAASIQDEQRDDINDPYWDDLVHEITIDEAVGAVIHGGSTSDTLTNVDNPVVVQNEGVSGFTSGYTDEATGKTYKFNIHSQTLIGSSFNPDLAYEWGLIEGNSGLWLNRFHLWGTGLTQRRTPYNGRNYEYISEDPMLTNRIGYGILQGCADKGIINGPKHMGFNDQEHNRGGVSAYMTEQKFRETDMRGFQGGLSDAKGLGVMIAFNRIGATNAAHHAEMLTTMLRDEWGYEGLISTDMMNNKYYFNAESMVMSGITQVADFAQSDNHINQGENGVDKTWAYLSVDAVKNDSALVEKARENLKYQLYTFANSAVLNVTTERVNTWWDNAVSATKTVTMVLACLSCAAWLALTLIAKKKEG